MTRSLTAAEDELILQAMGILAVSLRCERDDALELVRRRAARTEAAR